MMNCKKALQETKGDFEEAVKDSRTPERFGCLQIRKWIEKAIEGVVNSYILYTQKLKLIKKGRHLRNNDGRQNASKVS